MWNFLTFRRMLMPTIIVQSCYVGIIVCIVIGAKLLRQEMVYAVRFGNVVAEIPVGIAVLLLGPFAVRFACELLILPFRIHETLAEVRHDLRRRP